MKGFQGHPIFEDPVFQTESFRLFASKVLDAIAQAAVDEDASLRQHVPAICNSIVKTGHQINTKLDQLSNQIDEVTKNTRKQMAGYFYRMGDSLAGMNLSAYVLFWFSNTIIVF